MYEVELKRALLALEWENAAERFMLAARRLVALLGKANFNPAQPRVPAGNSEGGEWTGTGGGSGGARVFRVNAQGRSSVSVRTRGAVLNATPGQAARLAIAEGWARASGRKIREIDPTWRPRPSLTDPNSVEGAIRRAEGEAREAEARLKELARGRFGDNKGPPLDPPRAGSGSDMLPPIEVISSYRAITGMPDIGERAAGRSSEGTVAFTTVDDTPVFGVNSNSPAYTVTDQAAAERMRDRLVGLYPDMMETDYLGRYPNAALFHAEANALLRAAAGSGHSLSGREFVVRVDRGLCFSCELVLPKLGLQIGNPAVTFIDGNGDVWIMRDGIWLKRGRR